MWLRRRKRLHVSGRVPLQPCLRLWQGLRLHRQEVVNDPPGGGTGLQASPGLPMRDGLASRNGPNERSTKLGALARLVDRRRVRERDAHAAACERFGFAE